MKAEEKKALLESLQVPPEGEGWQVRSHFILGKQYEMAVEKAYQHGAYLKSKLPEDASKESLQEIEKEVLEKAGELSGKLTTAYMAEQQELFAAAKAMRDSWRAETYEEGKKRSDVARKLHADMIAYNKQQKKDPPPPLDEEYLAELDKTPLPKPGDPAYQNPWNTADTLYKSEAYDSFGQKYLLGLFETKEEAHEVFKKWNDEFTEGRAKLKEEVIQWGKQQQAILDKDPDAQERIKKAVEEQK